MPRRKGLVVAACLAVILVGFAAYRLTRPDVPGRQDIDTSAFVAYPGSTMTKDSFQRADSGRYIDTGSFSNPTQLIRAYRFATALPPAEFYRWRDATYPLPGWRIKSRVDANLTLYDRTVGNVKHQLAIGVLGGPLENGSITAYRIEYSVI